MSVATLTINSKNYGACGRCAAGSCAAWRGWTLSSALWIPANQACAPNCSFFSPSILAPRPRARGLGGVGHARHIRVPA